MKIKVFHHILLENHWYSIIKEQYRLIKESGMLDEIDEFYITLSYLENNKKNKIIEVFYDRIYNFIYEDEFFYNKKVNIIEHKKEEFEYPTLEKAVEISKENQDFIGFYLHTKGSANLSTDNEMMRESLNEGCINYWREHTSAIKEDYDMSGINLVYKNPNVIMGEPATKYYKTFYSGNFFFFSPNFFKEVDFSKVDKKIRYYAESIYGLIYSPKFNNVGYIHPKMTFLKTGNIKIKDESDI